MGKHNEKSRYYFGIDLGTTNSVLAWTKGDPETEVIEPKVVKIEMPSQIAPDRVPEASSPWPAMEHNELLPSCVCFPYGRRDPIVGPHAKGALIRTGSRSVKSIKTQMGTGYSREFDGNSYNAPEISAKILKALVDGAPSGFPKEDLLEEVVICVPASFDNKMRDATKAAAKIAKFKNPILLDEPHAALYDYRNQQERGEFPPGAIGIEFSIEPKLILVFDLGGGTLDVSLHNVFYDPPKNKLLIQDSVVSRYTAIGGDNFDRLIAEYFLSHSVNKAPRSFVQEYAERAKIDLSNKSKAILRAGKNPNTAETQINIPVLGGSFDLTLSEYEKIVSPLLAHNLTLETVKSNNIIYPIVDVLKKWEKDFGFIPEPDAVLLNGAMTRLHTIQKRLKDFFPSVPISVLGDPDKAVARGAVVHHCNL